MTTLTELLGGEDLESLAKESLINARSQKKELEEALAGCDKEIAMAEQVLAALHAKKPTKKRRRGGTKSVQQRDRGTVPIQEIKESYTVETYNAVLKGLAEMESATADELVVVVDYARTAVSSLLRVFVAEGKATRAKIPGTLRYKYTITGPGKAAHEELRIHVGEGVIE